MPVLHRLLSRAVILVEDGSKRVRRITFSGRQRRIAMLAANSLGQGVYKYAFVDLRCPTDWKQKIIRRVII